MSHKDSNDNSHRSPVRAFQRQPSMIDFPGRLAAVFFTGGCNFRCRYCHNAELTVAGLTGLPWSRLASACEEFSRNWVTAAVITGGEPTLHADLLELLAFFKKRGWQVKLDTNGSNPALLQACLPLTDYVAMDIKADLPGYREIAGVEDSRDIAKSIDIIKAKATDYCFRTTIVESFHTDARMHAIGALIRGSRRYVLQPFVPRDRVLDPAWRELKSTSDERMHTLRRLMAVYADEVC